MRRRRDAVRVLLLDPDDRVLLLRLVDEGGAAFWFPPGGGIAPGEDAGAAALRELREETGLTGVALGPELWRRRHVFTWRGEVIDQRERWFLAWAPAFTPDPAGQTAQERELLGPPRWWTPAELAAAGERLVPDDLAVRVRDLLDHGPPAAPVEL